MVGSKLITKQTGAAGRVCNSVMIAEARTPKHEYYVAILNDRVRQLPVLITSNQGGMSIEEVAKENPDAIITTPIDYTKGLDMETAKQVAHKLGFSGEQQENEAADTFVKLYKLFRERDATQVEINPLAESEDGAVLCMDAKLGFDEHADFRQKEVFEMRDLTQEDPSEVRASKYGLNFIKLDGNIGCLVNGAGLAMATLDLLSLNGGKPANFLDVGGGATKERVIEAFKIILADHSVKGVLINIFGGIVRCDMIAEAIIAAVQEVNVTVPVVVRLEGNNAELGAKLLDESGLKLISANGLADAAEKIVAAVKA